MNFMDIEVKKAFNKVKKDIEEIKSEIKKAHKNKVEDGLSTILNLGDLKKIRENNRKKKIGFCSGCYDILVPGHAAFFKKCKEYVDILVVDVGSDEVIKKLKGPKRPINPQENRVYLVASLKGVDYAIIGSEETLPGKIDFFEIVKELRPDVFLLNDDDSATL